MKYTRNWAWDTLCDVFFTDGTSWGSCPGTTDNKGRLIRFQGLQGKYYEMDDTKTLKDMGIQSIHFSTPAKVTIQ